MLKIENLSAETDGTKILNGIDLNIKPGETHAIMGPNGSGKSTLSKVIAGHPEYHVTSGRITYTINGRERNLLEMESDIRAKEGIFLGFQYPVEIPGVTNAAFLRAAFNEICRYHGAEELDPIDFQDFLKQKMKMLEMDDSFNNRQVNVDFSGGEKKRNEILQMAVLSPRISFLDETDSGLDVDSMKIIAKRINSLKTKDNALILVTHYERLLEYIVPDWVHVLYKGKIIKTGDKTLASKIEKNGYDWLIKGQ